MTLALPLTHSDVGVNKCGEGVLRCPSLGCFCFAVKSANVNCPLQKGPVSMDTTIHVPNIPLKVCIDLYAFLFAESVFFMFMCSSRR